MISSIGIGILYRVKLVSELTSYEEKVLKDVYSPELFDYSKYPEEGMISLRTEIINNDIYSFRKEILDFCELPLEGRAGESEDSVRSTLSNTNNVELIDILRAHRFYTLQDHELYGTMYYTDTDKFNYWEDIILIHFDGWRGFYPPGNGTAHDVTQMYRRILRHHFAHNKLRPLLLTFLVR